MTSYGGLVIYLFVAPMTNYSVLVENLDNSKDKRHILRNKIFITIIYYKLTFSVGVLISIRIFIAFTKLNNKGQ